LIINFDYATIEIEGFTVYIQQHHLTLNNAKIALAIFLNYVIYYWALCVKSY
jgi:hypothetical protein